MKELSFERPGVVDEGGRYGVPRVPEAGAGEATTSPPGHVADAENELILRSRGESRGLPWELVRCREGQGTTRRELAHSAFSEEWIVLSRRAGPHLPSTSTVGLAHQLRRAIFAAGRDPLSAALSGHRTDGSKQEAAHLAVVPLPDVGHRHAQGGILGFALVPPRGLEEAERRQLLHALGELECAHRERYGSSEEDPLIEC